MSVQWDGYAAGNEAGAKITIRNVNLQRHQMRTALPYPQDFLQVQKVLCGGATVRFNCIITCLEH
jgi:hypothetical protein